MASRLVRNLLAILETEEAAKGNNGTVNSFNNHGNGNQDFSRSKINSGAYSGDGNRHYTSNNNGGRAINDNSTGASCGYGNGNW